MKPASCRFSRAATIARALAAALTAVVALQAIAAESSRTTARLATRDRQGVVQTGCIARGAEGAMQVEAWTEKGARTVFVEARCTPHDMLHGVPLARITRCDNAAGAWRCDEGRESLQVTLQTGKMVAVVPNGLPAASAIEAVREAAKLTIRPFYRPAAWVIKDECRVDTGKARGGRRMENFEIRCGETVVFLTKDCGGESCRYFIPFALNY